MIWRRCEGRWRDGRDIPVAKAVGHDDGGGVTLQGGNHQSRRTRHVLYRICRMSLNTFHIDAYIFVQ